jgi:acetyl/propionyl-CoA carboxylase alpha subunit
LRGSIAEAVVVADELAGASSSTKASKARSKVVRLHRAGGGGEGEHVVDRGDDLEGALVAVALDAIDPFGVDDAAERT